MSIFDYNGFSSDDGGSTNQFVVNAKKFARVEAIEIFTRECDYIIEDRGLRIPTEEDIEERYCAYRLGIFDEGCYTFVNKGDRGSFPVWVIDFDSLKIGEINAIEL